MALSPWVTLRQAREALRTGRPDEAQRLLEPLVADGYRKAVKLMREVAKAYLARAERHLRADNAEGAWVDLRAVESLNTGELGATQLRQTLTKLGVATCRAAFEAGNPLRVIEFAARLADRSVRSPELGTLVEATQEWIDAAEQADRGEFLLAKETLGRAQARVDAILTAGLLRFSGELDARLDRFRVAVGQLNDACEAKQWRDALHWADEAIATAPNHREARSLRAKAWSALQPEPHTAPYRRDNEEVPLAVAGVVGVAAATAPTMAYPAARPLNGLAVARPSTVGGPTPLPKRFLLWIDDVGGYLVCLSPRIMFGQAVGDGPVDIPLFAELSRLHAEVFRDGEGYVMESTREVLINGTASARSVLKPGDRLTLGPTCQLVFHQPVAISPSARLELASGHRLPLAVDGVLLMAETLILGTGSQVHVQLPGDLKGNVVLYRNKDGLGVRCPGAFRVDGRPCVDRSDLPLPSVVTSDQFTFAVEPVGPRL